MNRMSTVFRSFILKNISAAVYAILLSAIFSSCNYQRPTGKDNEPDTRFNNLYTRAKLLLDTHPDSALIYADSAKYLAGQNIYSKGKLFSIANIQSMAWIEKGSQDSSNKILERNWLLANNHSDTISQARLAQQLGISYMNQGKYYLAEKFLGDAVNLYQLLGLDLLMANAEANYGAALLIRGEISKSQQHLLSAYKIFERLDSLHSLSAVCLNIGNNYAELGDNKEAVKYYKKAYSVAPPHSPEWIGAIANLGILYRNISPDSALYYYRIADSLNQLYGCVAEGIRLKYNRGSIYQDKKQHVKALAIFKEVAVLCRQNEIPSGLPRVYSAIAISYESINRFDSAIYYASLALHLTDSLGERRITPLLLQQLAGLYSKTGNLPRVIEYYQRAKAISDSLNTKNSGAVGVELDLLSLVKSKEMESNQLKMNIIEDRKKLQTRFIIIAAMSVFIILLGLLLRRNIKLNRERLNAYLVLMNQYIAERAAANNGSSAPDPTPPILQDLENNENSLLTELVNYYLTAKPYLDPNLKLNVIEEKLNTNRRAIAIALKTFHNANFNTFTNYFRVEEAKRLMEDPRCKNFKIEAIAREAGFGTRMSFYNAFQNQTGVKPSYYRESIMKAGELQPEKQ